MKKKRSPRRRKRGAIHKAVTKKQMPRWLWYGVLALTIAAALGLLWVVIFNPQPLPNPVSPSVPTPVNQPSPAPVDQP